MSLFNALNISITMISWLSNARVKCVCCSWSQPHAFSWLRWRAWREKFLQTPPSVRSFSCTSSAQKLNFFGRSRIFLPVENVFCQDNRIGKGCGSRVNNSNNYNSYKNTDIENKLLILNRLKISG